MAARRIVHLLKSQSRIQVVNRTRATMARAVAEEWVAEEAVVIGRKRKAGELALELAEAKRKVRRLEIELGESDAALAQRREEAGEVVSKVLGVKGAQKELVTRVLADAGVRAQVSWGREADYVRGEGDFWRAWVRIVLQTEKNCLGDELGWVEWVAEMEERWDEPARRYVRVRDGGVDGESMKVVACDWDDELDASRGVATGALGAFLGAKDGMAEFWKEMERPDWEAIRYGKLGSKLWGRWASVEASMAGWDVVGEMLCSRENVLEVVMKDGNNESVLSWASGSPREKFEQQVKTQVILKKVEAMHALGEARLAAAKHETAMLVLEGEIERGEVVVPTVVVVEGPGIEIE